MASKQKVAVFSAYKPLLHILTIYDMNNFQNQTRPILIRNICQAISLSIIFVSVTVALICDAWYFIDQHFHLADIALALGILISVTQLAITYISIRMKNDLANEVIAALEKIIIHREYNLHPFNWNGIYDQTTSSTIIIFIRRN